MRIAITAAAVCLSIVGLSVAEDAGAAMKKQFTNIPAQGLGPALQTLAQQREFQVVYLSDNVDSLRTVGAVGEMTSDEALTQLLIGTGGSVLNSVCEARARLFHGGGRRLRRTTDAVGKSVLKHLTPVAA